MMSKEFAFHNYRIFQTISVWLVLLLADFPLHGAFYFIFLTDVLNV